MGNYFQKTWRNVDTVLKNRKSPSGAGIGYSVNTNWYNELMTQSVSRDALIKRYDEMDSTVHISRALDIIAEDISSDDFDKEEPILIEYPEKTKTTSMSTINGTLRTWMKLTEFDYKFFDFIREAGKYGMITFLRQNDFSLKKLEPRRIIGYVVSEKDPSIVTHYIYDTSKELTNKQGDKVNKEGDDTIKIPVEKLFIIKFGDLPLGESLIEKVFRTWRQFTLLEDAVVIYRIVRAPERRVFYIDTGTMSGTKAEAYLNRIKNKMRQKQLAKGNSGIDTQYNPGSMIEDMFIAQSGEGKGSRVETLPGGDNLGKIEDLMYFNKQLSFGLRIPPSYLDSFSDSGEGQYNDGRVGTAYISEARYANYIIRLQKMVAKQLFEEFKKYMKYVGVDPVEDMELGISPPQNFGLYKQTEINSTLLNVYSSAENIAGMSKIFAMKKYLDMDEEEIQENIETKLEELGIDAKIARKLPQHIRLNLVFDEQKEAGMAYLEKYAEDLGIEVSGDSSNEDTGGGRGFF